MTADKQNRVDTTKNPFPGLRPFKFGESHLFFGREGQTENVVNKILDKHFVAIIGASGVGKSSFMSCGVLSDILEENEQEGNNWEVFMATPGNSPMHNLAKGLLNGIRSDKDQLENKTIADQAELEKLTAQLLESPEGLIQILQTRNSASKYLLFVDQFEEVFRFPPDDIDANESVKALVNLITTSIAQTEVPIYVVLSIRSDFIGDCARFPALTEAINSSQYLIPQLTREQKKDAIVGPVHFMGANIEEALVEKVLEDVGERGDELPIMQHAMMRTWDYWQNYRSVQEQISVEDYEAIGGMKNALSEHAREAFRELNEKERVICERIFKALTEKGEEGRGVRRPTALKEIAAITDADKKDILRIVEYFRMPGRSLLLPPAQVPLDDDTMIDISHESLMRNWVELVEWVDEEAESVKLYLRLAEAAGMHQEGKAGLWRPPDLLLAQNWQSEQQPTQAWGLRHHKSFERTMLFLDHSAKEYERDQRIKEKLQKRRITIFRRIAAVMFLLCLVAGWFWIDANEQKERALVATKEAQEERKNAEEQKEKAQQNAAEAKRQQAIAVEQTGVARYNAKLAIQQQQLAELERIKALQQESIASVNAKIAIFNEREAASLRLLSIAKSMAIKSMQISEPEVKGLVARQAFNFNSKQGGRANDPDIYDGLYYALKSLKSPEHFNLDEHDQNVRALVASRKGRKIYSTGSDGKIIEWTYGKERPIAKILSTTSPTRINKSLAVNESQQLLAVGGDFNYIEIHDLNNPVKKVEKVATTWSDTWFLSYAPNNSLLAVGSNNKIMQLVGDEFKPISAGKNKINALAIHDKENSIVAAQNNGQLIKYNLDTKDSVLLFNNDYPLYSVSYSKDGKYLCFGDEKGRIILINILTSGIKILPGHSARINNISFSNDGTKMATGSFDKTVRIWNLNQLEDAPVVLRDHRDWVWSIIFNEDDSRLWAGSRDYLIRLWPVNTDDMAAEICQNLERNKLNTEEWKKYAGDDFAEADSIITCNPNSNYLSINNDK